MEVIESQQMCLPCWRDNTHRCDLCLQLEWQFADVCGRASRSSPATVERANMFSAAGCQHSAAVC
jgi:hypothetical protein